MQFEGLQLRLKLFMGPHCHRSLRHWSDRIVLLAVGLGMSLTFGCSSSSSNLNGSKNYDARLKGSYVYVMSGSIIGLPSGGYYQRAGTFTSDGAGNITGIDDFVQNGSPSTQKIAGTYTVEADGTGLMVLTIGSTQLQWVLTLTSSSQLSMIEFDSTITGAGGALSQDTTALNMPDGTYVLRSNAFQLNTQTRHSVATVGQFAVSAGSISGSEASVHTGVFSSLSLTGSLESPDKSGKGTLSLTDGSGSTSNYFYYIIDANTLQLLETDSDPANGSLLGGGRCFRQSSGPFDLTTLSPQSVLSESGDSEQQLFGVVSVAGFSSDGNGNIVSGSYDTVRDGIPAASTDLTGTYTVSPQGRVKINFNSSASGPLIAVGWFSDATHAYFVLNVPGLTAGGTIYQQTFSSSDVLSGQFSFTMFGHDNQSPPLIDRLGVSSFSSNSMLALPNYFVSRTGLRSQTSEPAVAYNLSANGRLQVSIPNVSSNVVMYMVSDGLGYLIDESPDSQIAGSMAQQSFTQ